ncbi:MAG: hypothetical protein Q9202_003182 [Teloschistes flavicans]
MDAGIISFRDLIDFISHVADCYPTLVIQFPEDLIRLLNLHHEHLESELREKIVGSLVLLRRKDIIDSPRISSKGLWAVKVTRELWKRQIWTDTKAVEIMKEACLADNEKIIVGGVRFFLGGDKEREEFENESSDEEVDMGKIKHQIGINKKSKKKARLMENAVATVKKQERKKKQPHPLNFSAFHLLRDPQGFAETLFSKHLQNSKSKLNLEQKLLVLQLISRLVGLHKLTVLSFYSYFIKYLTPRQPFVTSFLASLAQATHTLVPPDILEPLIQKIANEFVSEAAAAEVASAGLNAIREICVRQPLAMDDTLLQDLVMYRKSKDKGVMMAAKGLLGLYREAAPDMLKKRDRGKEAAMGLRAGTRKEQRFGEESVGQIEGLELLEKWKEEEKQNKLQARDGRILDGEEALSDPEDEDHDGWEVDEDSEPDSGGWQNVSSDDEGGNVDVHDERSSKKARRNAPTSAESKGGSEGECEGEDDLAEDSKDEDDDSDDEDNEENQDNTLQQAAAVAADKTSSLATTRILTPADLAKLQELRLAANINASLPSSHRKHRLSSQQTTKGNRHIDDPLTAAQIEGLASLSKDNKTTKDERIAAAKAGKDDKDQVRKSTTAKRKERKIEQGKSTTNREKARKKNFLMTLGKAKGKQKRSLVERGKVLKAHKEREGRGGRRGNR